MDAPTRAVVGMAKLSRGERTRARLLEAARVAFAETGWARARVEDVCRAAGVGHGTFYAYYGNRTEILEALVRQHAAALYQLVEGSWGSDGAPDRRPAQLRGDVRRVIAGFLALSERDRVVRQVWFSAAPSEPALAALVDEVRRQFVARIASNLRAAVAAGAARPDLDLEVAAAALAAMVEQAVTLALRGQDGPDGGEVPGGDRLVEGLTDLWVHAVYRSAG